MRDRILGYLRAHLENITQRNGLHYAELIQLIKELESGSPIDPQPICCGQQNGLQDALDYVESACRCRQCDRCDVRDVYKLGLSRAQSDLWVSVKDRLPERCENVLWMHDLQLRYESANFHDGPSLIVGYLSDAVDMVILNDLDEYDVLFPLSEFTFWMPLPPFPEVKE